MSDIQRLPSNIVSETIAKVEKELFLPEHATPAKKHQNECWTLLRVVSELPQAVVFSESEMDRGVSKLVRSVEMGITQDVANKAIAICSFLAKYGHEKAQPLLFTHIKYFLELINIQRKPTMAQVMDMVQVVLLEFSDLSISDVILCLRNIRTGKYGQLYETFSVEKLGAALRQYREEKAIYLEQLHDKGKNTPQNVLQAIINHAPAEEKQKLKENLEKAISNFESERVLPSADNLAFFEDKPKPKYKAAPMLTEKDFAEKIRYDLQPRLDSFTQEQFLEFIDYYFTHKQEELSEWLQSEYEKRFQL